MTFDATVRESVCRLRRPGTRWLSTGHAGGQSTADAAYNATVPDGWPETDLDAYVRERRERAGFPEPGPTLLTGVEQRHARRARLDGVEAVVTAGVSNPAVLPVSRDAADELGRANESASSAEQTDSRRDGSSRDGDPLDGGTDDRPSLGTVNVVVGTDRALAPGALANLVAVAAEAKAATLLSLTGFPGTTTDAVVVGCDPEGEPTPFSGSATAVGSAARACVRDALAASLNSRYSEADVELPASVVEAKYGVVTDVRADVSELP